MATHTEECKFVVLYNRAKKMWAANDLDGVVTLLMESNVQRATERARAANE